MRGGTIMNKTPRKSLILLACFLLPMAVMGAVLALGGICPFGSRSLGVMDMPHQYLSFLYALRDILTGKASALYLPSMALGGNMLGVMAYYLMSPLNLLLCLFSREGLYVGMSLLYLLRVGLCGLTCGIYCGKRHGWSWRLLIPALSYGLMAYMLAYAMNYLWQDCVILLPLVALGIARLREGKSPALYIISLAASLIINFYLGYILCLFSVLFYLYELFSVQNLRESAPVRRTVTFALSSLAAGALAAFILVPAFLSLAGGKASFTLSDLALTAKFSFPALFSKLLPGAFNYEEIMPVGMPHIFCGTVTTALAVLYFADSQVTVRRRILTGCLLGALALSFWIAALDLVWHGMNVPSWYNYRYSFLFSFLLIAAGDRALADFRTLRPWHFVLPAVVMAALGALAFVGRSYDYVSWTAVPAAVLTAAATGGALWLICRPQSGKKLAAVMAALLLLAHMGELGSNAYTSLKALTAPSTNPKGWAEYVSAKAQAFELIATEDAYVRVESPDSFSLNRCEPMLFGYDGISHYGSTLTQKNLDFLDALGFDRYTDLYALYSAGVPAGADSFLGVGYVVAQTLDKPYTPMASAGGYTVYENPFALPIGWTANAAIAGALDTTDCFAYIQALYSAAAPEVGQEIYIEAPVTDLVVSGFAATEGRRCILGDNPSGTIDITVTAQADGPLYGILEIPDFPGAMIYVNGQYTAYYANAQTNGALYLGTYAAGDQVTVSVQAATDMTLGHTAFATENAAALAAYHDAMADGGCNLTKLSNDRFTGAFTPGQGDALLVLTIPYDVSWHIQIDGQPVDAVEIQNCLTAIPVTAGAHTIEMRYIPAGLIPGACITAAALVLCFGAYLLHKKKK